MRPRPRTFDGSPKKPNVSTETLFRHRGTVVVSSLRGNLWAWLEPLRPGIFPSSMIARKLGPALAAGCTIVVKPSELTPHSGLAWGVLAEEAEAPSGVINVVTGSATAVGRELTRNPDVAKITFTGSTRVGKILMEQCVATLKRFYGTRWKRAIPRIRRRRRRSSGRWRDHREVSQFGSDLRVR